MHLVCCTWVICNEIEQGLTQKDIALTYAMALRSATAKADIPDWETINRAIIKRWSMSGLERIKKRAWGIVSGKIEP
jgi:hypothetical protein